MERRRDGSIAGRSILITDLGKLRWRSPKVEPHLTRIVKGTIETPVWPAQEATHELRIEDLEDYRTDPSIKRPIRVVEQGGDLMFDAHAGAQPEPTHMLDVEDLMEVDSEGGMSGEELPQETEKESPSVLASLETLKEIQRQRLEEEAQAARDRKVDATIAEELKRKPVERPQVQERDIFEAEDPEDLIEPADWELPDITEPVVASPGSKIMLFQNPASDEGKRVQLTPLCSVVLIDHDRDNGRAYLRINHEASGAWERVGLDLREETATAKIATDEGVGVLLRGRGRAVDAVILEPVDVLFPNFNVRDIPARQVDSVFWPYTAAKDAKPADLGHGYFLILIGSGQAGNKSDLELGFELYLSNKGNPMEYSKDPQYMRRFRLKRDGFKTFRIGPTRVDVTVGNLGVRVTKSEPEGARTKLPEPDARAATGQNDSIGESFDDAFAQFIGEKGQEQPRRKRITKPLHSLENVMGGPEQAPPVPPPQPADTLSVTMFEEICRTVKNTGLSEQNSRFLIEGISNSDARIRALAIRAFADAALNGENIAVARGYLIGALQDSDRDVKNNANDALFYATERGMELDPVLRATLEDPRRREESSVVLAVKDLKKLIPKKD